MKDANLADVHNGLAEASNPTSTTSRTAFGEIHTTLAHLSAGVAGGLTADERRQQTRTLPAEDRRSSPGITGRRALRAGRTVADVADDLGVTLRTAERWAAQVRSGWAS